MIITDREIKIAIERGIITIEPRPEERAFSSTSVDLTLDPIISEFKQQLTGIEQVLDPACVARSARGDYGCGNPAANYS